MPFYGVRQEYGPPCVAVASNVEGSEGENSVQYVLCGKSHLRDDDAPNLSDLGVGRECDRRGDCEVVEKLEIQRLWGRDCRRRAFRLLEVAISAVLYTIEA